MIKIQIVVLICYFFFSSLDAMHKDQAFNLAKARLLFSKFKQFSRSRTKIKMADPIVIGSILKKLYAKKIELAKKKKKKYLAYEYGTIEHGIYEAIETLIGLYSIHKKSEILQHIDDLMGQSNHIESCKLEHNPNTYTISPKRVEICQKLRELREI